MAATAASALLRGALRALAPVPLRCSLGAAPLPLPLAFARGFAALEGGEQGTPERAAGSLGSGAAGGAAPPADARVARLVEMATDGSVLPLRERRRRERAGFAERFARHDADVGSAAFQIAYQTKRIEQLTTHLQQHRQDKGALRQMHRRLMSRKKLMKYLRRDRPDEYVRLLADLGLRDLVSPRVVQEQRWETIKRHNRK